MTDLSNARERLVASLLRRGYIVSPQVEKAMRTVPREEFLPRDLRDEAYIDTPLPIGDGQTISAPHMVAIMVEKLDLASGLDVLEIGAGSGYHAAVVAEAISPGGHVYTMERLPSLAEFAQDNLRRTGYDRMVSVIVGDGSKGLPEHAPYDRIFVACGAPDIPQPLVDQLKVDGEMLIPVGERYCQDLIKVVRRKGGITKENHGGCVFVPLVGEHGYR